MSRFHGVTVGGIRCLDGLKSTPKLTLIAAQAIDLMRTLQEEFVASRGAPLCVNGLQVVQMDRLQSKDGRIRVLAAAPSPNQGIAIKAPSGALTLSDGRNVPLLHIWFDAGLPLEAIHKFRSGNGELRVWNIYRTCHPNGAVTEDAWTGNSGMAVILNEPGRRQYLCSPGYAKVWEPQLNVLIELLAAES